MIIKHDLWYMNVMVYGQLKIIHSTYTENTNLLKNLEGEEIIRIVFAPEYRYEGGDKFIRDKLNREQLVDILNCAHELDKTHSRNSTSNG